MHGPTAVVWGQQRVLLLTTIGTRWHHALPPASIMLAHKSTSDRNAIDNHPCLTLYAFQVDIRVQQESNSKLAWICLLRP
jgi:hypothetical protein